MKDKKIILLVISCAVIIFLSFYFLNKKMEMQQTQKAISDFAVSKQLKEEFYSINFEYHNKMTGEIAPDVLCRKRKGEDYFLSKFIKEKPLLIYRYANINCNSCFEKEIKELFDVFADDPNLVIILSSYNVMRDFFIYKANNGLDISVFYIDSNSLRWPIEELNKPYYFVLHSNMRISNIYISPTYNILI